MFFKIIVYCNIVPLSFGNYCFLKQMLSDGNKKSGVQVTNKMLVYQLRGLKEVQNIRTLNTVNRKLYSYHTITLHDLILYFQIVGVLEQKTRVIFHTFITFRDLSLLCATEKKNYGNPYCQSITQQNTLYFTLFKLICLFPSD